MWALCILMQETNVCCWTCRNAFDAVKNLGVFKFIGVVGGGGGGGGVVR